MGIIFTVEWVALAILLALSAFFSSSETVFFSLNPLQIRRLTQKNPRRGEQIHRLLAQPTRLLSGILIGNTVVNVTASAVGLLAVRTVAPAHSEPVAIFLMTVLLLLFGEYGPKRLGLRYTERLALAFIGPLRALVAVTRPLRALLEGITRRFESAFRPRGHQLSDAEFATVVDIGREEGILREDELAMIKAIIKLDDLRAADVMTPRVKLQGLDLDEARPATLVTEVRQARANYLLLYRGQMDEVEGALDVRRFLLNPERGWEAARLEPLYVPETAPLSRLLTQFQKEKKRVAVVADEYGGVAGVVTRGDILEEITGEIYQEMSKPRPIFQEAGPGRWLVDANLSLEEINDRLGLRLEADGVDRLSGWLSYQLGRLPRAKDEVVAQGARVVALQTQKLRLALAQIEALPAGAEKDETAGGQP